MANDVYQFNILGLAENQPWESVLHFESNVANSTTPLTVASNLVAAFGASVQTTFRACLADDALITGFKSKRVNNTGGPQLLDPISPVTGSFGDNSHVASISGVVLSYYTQGTKTRTGRWFLPGLPDTAYDDGVFSSPYKAAVAAMISAITGTLTSGGSTFHFGVWAAKTTTFMLPSLVKLSGHLGTQRRRLVPLI